MLITEPPSVSEMDDTILEPGTVVSSEPAVVTDEGVFIWEDVLAIKDDGHEVLTRNETDELIVIK